jgi:DNA repair protein RadD
MPQRPPRQVEIDVDGELGEVRRDRRVGVNQYDRNEWHGMLAAIAAERGYQPGWIAHKYREKFGVFPPWGVTPELIEPTREVRSWVRSRNIAYAKRRGVV